MKNSMKVIICLAAIISAINGQNADPCELYEDNTFLNDPSACNAYVECINGVSIPGTCPGDLFFDPVNILCNYPEEVDCTDYVTTLPPPIEIECYPDGIEFHPHPYSCSKYVMCFAGWQIDMQCASGFHWSIYEGFCTTPDIAECSIEKSLCPETNNPEEIFIIPSSRDCNIFYICYNQTTIPMNCAPGMHWNPVEQWCDEPELAGCEVTVTPTPDPNPNITEIVCPFEEGISWEPHPIVCNYFFLCANNVSYLQHCAPGLHFDMVERLCMLESDATCYLDYTTVEPETTTEIEEITTHGPDFITEIECLSPGSYFVEHPQSCQHYFLCLNFDSVLLECAPDLIFDIIGLWCSPSADAVCGATPAKF